MMTIVASAATYHAVDVQSPFEIRRFKPTTLRFRTGPFEQFSTTKLWSALVCCRLL